MKKNIIYSFAIFAFGFVVLTSCTKDKEPAATMSGIFTGSFEGEYEENTVLESDGYQVLVTALNDNKVTIAGPDFENFDVLVTSNGINVEPVSQADPYLLDFIFISDENKLKFTYNKGINTAEFIGVR
ncbi:MAG: hypothetical protein P8I55_05590 [Crocinitomix sp.]|nr:hypothetical protein [Crocinitomix sp.]